MSGWEGYLVVELFNVFVKDGEEGEGEEAMGDMGGSGLEKSFV